MGGRSNARVRATRLRLIWTGVRFHGIFKRSKSGLTVHLAPDPVMKKLLVPARLLLLMIIGMPPAYGDSCSTADAALNASNPRASDGIRHNLFVADTANNRVLVFTL
jgi:hypothetical protein